MRLSLLAALVTVFALACGGGGGDDNGKPGAATETPAPMPTQPATGLKEFLLGNDSGGAGVWHVGAPLPGIVVGPLCSALGGAVELAVNTGEAAEARSFGGKFVGITREGAGVLWLPGAATTLGAFPTSVVIEAQVIARLDDHLTVDARGAYLICK